MISKKKKSISILTISLASGGAEKVISLLLPELVKSYNVYLILFYNVIHFDIPKEVKTIILNGSNSDKTTWKILNFPHFIIKYHRFLRKHKPDIAVSFLTRPNLINGMMKIRFPGLKIILSERGYPSINYKSSSFRYGLYKILIPILYNRADVVFSNSISINHDLRNNFRIVRPLKVIYNPVMPIKQKKYLPSIILKIITVGSLRPIKNHSMILDAIQNIPNSHLTILGDGKLRNDLEQRAKNLGIGHRVDFKGIVKDVNRFLNQSDCFVLSSNSEGFPNVILEAMAVGLPVISTNCLSGPLEILNENKEVIIQPGDFVKAKYGILINNGDSKGLEKAFKYFQDHPHIFEDYGNLGYERVKNYSIKNIYTVFNKMIEEL